MDERWDEPGCACGNPASHTCAICASPVCEVCVRCLIGDDFDRCITCVD